MTPKRFSILIILLAVVLSACAPAATPTPTPEPTATPNFTGAGETLVCLHPLLPADVAATWEYVLTDPNQQVVNYVATVEDVQPAGFMLLNTYTDETSTDNQRIPWDCSPDGLSALAPILGVQWLPLILPGATLSNIEMVENEGVTLPAVINLGDTWTQVLKTRSQVTVDGQTEELLTTYTFNFTAKKSEDLTVRALSQTALVLEITGSIETTRANGSLPVIEFSSAQWYVPAVGLAKAVSIIKIAGETNRVESLELTSFVTTR